MNPMSRRTHLQGLMGMAALATTGCATQGAMSVSSGPVPPEGIGRNIKFLSYSDQGGRPDGVQVMYNRKHVYVGHMFNDGVTVLDANDPRNLKPVGFFTAGAGTRTHQMQNHGDILLLGNGAKLLALAANGDFALSEFLMTIFVKLKIALKYRAGGRHIQRQCRLKANFHTM